MLLDPLIAFGVAMALCIGGVVFVFHMAKIEQEAQARTPWVDRAEALSLPGVDASYKDAA